MNELRIRLQPKQKLFRDSIEKFPVTLYGGAKGGGKSKGLRDIFLLRRFEYPGSIGAIFRKSYPDLRDNHINKIFEEYPGLFEYWHDQNKELTLPTLPSKSVLKFRYCANEEDVKGHEGREYHDLGIEEAGQWSEPMIVRLRGSNRSSKQGIVARTALTANPGGTGHGYLKRIFIERRYNERELSSDYNFIQALVDDNPALLTNDPEYVRRLLAEPNEALRRAYRYGDWDIFAGQFFGELSRDVHFIKSFEIPSHWVRFGAYDYGFNHPAAFGWFATDEDGNVFLYRELVKAVMRVDQFAAAVREREDVSKLVYIVAGHDCWAKKHATINKEQGPNPPTIAEEFAKHEIFLRQANIDRINGAAQVRAYLAWQKHERKKPRFYIFDACPLSFDCLSRMQTDPDRLEDVLKVDATDGDPMTGDDAYDMLRYALMSRPILSDAPKIRKPGTPEYDRQVAEDLFQHHLEKLQREKENKDGQGINWQTDPNGVPPWNQWDDDSGGNPFGQ